MRLPALLLLAATAVIAALYPVNVVARLPIAAGGGLHQHPMLVAQVDGQAVELQLGGVLQGRRLGRQLQFAAHPGIKGLSTRRGGVGLGADAEHGHGMAHRRKSVEHGAAHALGRRVGAEQFGVLSLERL